MAKWRVYNEHPHGLTHTEKFKEETIVIKAGEFVLMDYEDAVQFRSQYFPRRKNAQGADDPKGFKVIHLKPHDEDAPKVVAAEFICHRDGAKFPTQALLDKHVADNYAAALVQMVGGDFDRGLLEVEESVPELLWDAELGEARASLLG